MNIKVDLLKKLVQASTEDFSRTERVMFLRYFLKETFKWMPQRVIADITGISSPSTVSLQIKKLNEDEKYHFTIVKIRQMIRELQLDIL